jgi:hypothetical protein
MKFLILIFFIFNSLYSQVVSRMQISDTLRGTEFTRRWKTEPLQFKSPLEGSETIDLGIVSDSLDSGRITLSIFVYYPKRINPNGVSITIQYDDRTKDMLLPLGDGDSLNYVQYDFANSRFSIHKKKVVKIKFSEISSYEIEYPDYFIQFIKEIFPN